MHLHRGAYVTPAGYIPINGTQSIERAEHALDLDERIIAEALIEAGLVTGSQLLGRYELTNHHLPETESRPPIDIGVYTKRHNNSTSHARNLPIHSKSLDATVIIKTAENSDSRSGHRRIFTFNPAFAHTEVQA